MKDDSPKPRFDVEFYGYGDMEIVQHPLGACICYAGTDGMFGCNDSGLKGKKAKKIVLAEH
jgi:hypothetical protein